MPCFGYTYQNDPWEKSIEFIMMKPKKLSFQVIYCKIELINYHKEGQIDVKNVTFSTKCNNFNINRWQFGTTEMRICSLDILKPKKLLKY